MNAINKCCGICTWFRGVKAVGATGGYCTTPLPICADFGGQYTTRYAEPASQCPYYAPRSDWPDLSNTPSGSGVDRVA